MLEPKQIAKNYLRGWFTVDLVSCFPITYIELIASDGGKSEAGRQMKVLKITRLLRLVCPPHNMNYPRLSSNKIALNAWIAMQCAHEHQKRL